MARARWTNAVKRSRQRPQRAMTRLSLLSQANRCAIFHHQQAWHRGHAILGRQARAATARRCHQFKALGHVRLIEQITVVNTILDQVSGSSRMLVAVRVTSTRRASCE